MTRLYISNMEVPMLGQMITSALTIQSLVDHAARYHTGTEVYFVNTGGGVEETTWGQVGANAHRLGHALSKLGLETQARCGTIAPIWKFTLASQVLVLFATQLIRVFFSNNWSTS